jgi:homeobox protein cut-like
LDDVDGSHVGIQEAARAYSNMNPVEKALFTLTRAILGNKKARTAFILYACTLHLLVLYTTWECALSGNSQDQFQKQLNPFVRSSFALAGPAFSIVLAQ